MTLRVSFEIVPFGEEVNKRKIFRADISNTGDVRDEGFGHVFCSYNVKLFSQPVHVGARDDEPEWQREWITTIKEHDRRAGAFELVRTVFNQVKEEGFEF